MNPFYFGTAERRIFGIYEPAAAVSGPARAVLLCQPWGPEYVFAHRSMRQLATRLAASGFHTLRFDYFGTGDSAGELQSTDLGSWEDDVLSAIETLKDTADTAKVSLVGLRFGANLAANIAALNRQDLEALVLWDPIASGERWLRSLNAPVATPADVSASVEVQGYRVSGRLLQQFGALRLPAKTDSWPRRSLMIVTERLQVHESMQKETLIAAAMPVEFLSAACPWIESATTTGALPVPVIQRIETWLR